MTLGMSLGCSGPDVIVLFFKCLMLCHFKYISYNGDDLVGSCQRTRVTHCFICHRGIELFKDGSQFM